MLPIFPLVNVHAAKFPIFARLINAFAESFALFTFRQVQGAFDDLGAVSIQALLQILDGLIPLLSNSFFVAQPIRQHLAVKHFRMHPDDQHFS